jgi:hypothetical protein
VSIPTILTVGLLACAGGAPGGGAEDTGCPGCEAIAYDDDPSDVATDPFDVRTLQEHVGYLASVELAGREAGSAGDGLAIDYIERAFQAYGIEAPGGGYRRDFLDSNGTPTQNVAAVLWGRDAAVADEIVILSAHHDHLGVGRRGEIYRGANDNASGVSGLLAVADALSREAPLRRTVVFLATGSEEVNLDGSRAWTEDPPPGLPLADTAFVLNLDMIGTYDYEDVVYALDAAPGTPGRSALEASPRGGLTVDTDYTSSLSDLDSFCDADVPGMMFYTDDDDYHAPSDVPAQLDYDHLADIVTLAADVLRALADGEHGLAAARAAGCGKR